MRRSTNRRASNRPGLNRRILAAAATLVVFGGLVTVTQISNAETELTAVCESPAPAAPEDEEEAAGGEEAGAGEEAAGNQGGAGEEAPAEEAPAEEAPAEEAPAEEAPEEEAPAEEAPAEEAPAEECTEGEEGTEGDGGTQPGQGREIGGVPVLPSTCEGSDLAPHDGFQNGSRCVSTSMGEVSAAEQNPTLLITRSPRTVRANQAFTLQVSTRNLVRDRFLPAGQGGYYLESSFLTDEGLTRGHFHTACRMLDSTRQAPDPAPVPAFFVATEDRQGGAEPDTVTIQVPGLPQRGLAQCAVWAGDGSHRIPLMTRANQTPAFDAVRVIVR